MFKVADSLILLLVVLLVLSLIGCIELDTTNDEATTMIFEVTGIGTLVDGQNYINFEPVRVGDSTFVNMDGQSFAHFAANSRIFLKRYRITFTGAQGLRPPVNDINGSSIPLFIHDGGFYQLVNMRQYNEWVPLDVEFTRIAGSSYEDWGDRWFNLDTNPEGPVFPYLYFTVPVDTNNLQDAYKGVQVVCRIELEIEGVLNDG